VGDEILCCQHACHEILAAEENKVSDSDMTATLLAVHKNMDHPSNEEMVRVLKCGQASNRALTLARQLTCPQCEASRKPSIPLPKYRGSQNSTVVLA
jgi:hypothetical protein